jgi:hypothetical protein
MARDVMSQLISTGEIHRGQLGLVTFDVASKAGLKDTRDGQLQDMSARLGELKPESGRSGGFFDR